MWRLQPLRSRNGIRNLYDNLTSLFLDFLLGRSGKLTWWRCERKKIHPLEIMNVLSRLHPVSGPVSGSSPHVKSWSDNILWTPPFLFLIKNTLTGWTVMFFKLCSVLSPSMHLCVSPLNLPHSVRQTACRHGAFKCTSSTQETKLHIHLNSFSFSLVEILRPTSVITFFFFHCSTNK